MIRKRALFVGRFQPLHLGHLYVIQEIVKNNYKLLIGIGSSQISYQKDNPFTAKERENMINDTLKEEFGYGLDYELILIPDIFNDDKWVSHVERLCPEFDVVYTNNGHTKILFEREGCRVIETKRFKINNQLISGNKIREMISEDQDGWKGLVPSRVYKKILEIDGVKRIKELYS